VGVPGHKMVFVTRKELELTKGKLAAQVGHAAVECTLKAMRYGKETVEEWLADGQKKSVLKVAGERDLYPLKEAAERAGLTTALIKDAGHTHIAPGTVTVLGIGPGREDLIDKVTGHLQLL
jgi:peptidyl-tRNA hydrolase, PTH2 family